MWFILFKRNTDTVTPETFVGLLLLYLQAGYVDLRLRIFISIEHFPSVSSVMFVM